MKPNVTENEIVTQVEAWQDAQQVLQDRRRAIESFWEQGQYSQVIFTGCGSTHYLSLAAASMMQSVAGVVSRAVPASELLLHPESIYVPDVPTLLVTVSRSAATTETVQAARLFKNKYGPHVLTISCYDDKPLNQEAAFTLTATAGQEESVAQTRSFSSMLVLAEGFARIAGGHTLDDERFHEDNRTSIEQARSFAADYSDPEQFTHYFFLGSGPLYGLAAEGMLKMKEMSLTHAEVYHPLEFRHGPMSMVDQKTVVLGLIGTQGQDAELEVLDEMRHLGATTICAGPLAAADYPLPVDPARASLVRYLPLMQWMAFSRAIHKKLDPDHPRNLAQVVHLPDGPIR
jgi:glucosamine--fructose-6-phosphate aminotransferase (isomerizing)